MPSNYEQRLTAFYLANVAARFNHGDPEAAQLADWLECRDNQVVFPGRRRSRVDWTAHDDERLTARKWRGIQNMLRAEHSALKSARPDLAAQRLRRLGKTVGLTQTDIDILELLLRQQSQPVIEGMISDIFSRRRLAAVRRRLAVPFRSGAETLPGLRRKPPIRRAGEW